MNNIMKQYIRDQKNVLPLILKNISRFDFIKKYSHIKKIVIAASGSSKNVATVVQAALYQGIDIIVQTPFCLLHNSCAIEKSQLLIAISQTGKSSGTLDCVRLAKKHNIPTLAITADLNSPLSTLCEDVLDIYCADETIGPKTKGYTCTLLILFLVILKIMNKSFVPYIEEWNQDIQNIDSMIIQTENFLKHHKEWSLATCISVIGCGIHYGSACEGNLKLLETMQIPAMCYELEEFMHGAHRTVHENSYLIFLHTHNDGYDMMERLITFAYQQKAHVIVIDDQEHQYADLIVPKMPLTQAMISITIILQVMASLLPEYKGINPSDPVLSQFAKQVGTREA